MSKRLLLSTVATAALGAALFAAPAPASAQSSTAASAQTGTFLNAPVKKTACRTIVINRGWIEVGAKVNPFTNGEVLRLFDQGDRLTSCGFVTGDGSNSYTGHCGRSGRNWFQVNLRVPTRDEIGIVRNKGFVATTCATVLKK